VALGSGAWTLVFRCRGFGSFSVVADVELAALCGAEDSGAAAEVSSSGRLSGFWQDAKRNAEVI